MARNEEEKVTNVVEPEPQPEPCTMDRPKIRLNALEENADPLGRKKRNLKPKMPKEDSIISTTIEPTISTRICFKYENPGIPGEYIYPPTPQYLKIQKENRTDTAKAFCQFQLLDVPKPLAKKEIDTELEVPSPEPSQAKVQPRRASPSPSLLYPDAQAGEDLELKKPKSGIYINEKGEEVRFEDYDSFDLVYQNKPRPELPHAGGPRPGGKKEKLDDILEGDEATGKRKKKKSKKKKKRDEVEEEETDKKDEDYEPCQDDEFLTKMLRKKVSQMSATTSYNSKDLRGDDEDDPLNKLLQKFRRESDIKRWEPKERKIKRGTVIAHSYTDICQKPLKSYFFGVKMGTMHQGDDSFPEHVRNRQGVCMPIAAFCLSILEHPNKWTRETIDEILIYGNNLFLESLEAAHIHTLKRDIEFDLLRKYIKIRDKKLRFYVDDADMAGLIKSDDKIVFNLTHALTLFFDRHNAGILQTEDLWIGIWKQKYLYMFDAKPRCKDLYCSPAGAAVMANFYDVAALAASFLKRSNFGNWPFIIYPLKVYRMINADDPELPSTTDLDARSEYNILNENKAVVLGSFDLGDKCFAFTRNKQALAMTVVALVYSRITPPSAWHRRTLDKILILGNLLYKECLNCTTTGEVKLCNLPAIFTIGPYIAEIYIFGNVYANLVYRSCVCELQVCMELFFSKCANGILQIGKCYLGIWKQRNMLYCFDPYSRNNEAYVCRDGKACVSMHSTLESLIETIVHNFDKDTIFYLHALKVCKIHRDPVQSTRFPKHICMDDFPLEAFKQYKMKKSKKPATEKPVTVDYTAIAMRRLLCGESPQPSIVEVGSRIDSLQMDQINAYMKKCPSRIIPVDKPHFHRSIADLDSPSLEDTQIEPPLPQQSALDEEIGFMDLDSIGATMEEIEGGEGGEGEGEDVGEYEAEIEGICDDGEGFGEDDDFYWGKGICSQYDLEGPKVSQYANTDISYFPIKREILYPTYLRGKQDMRCRLAKARMTDDDWENYLPPMPPDVTKSEELRIETNFIDLPDDTQIILGSKNVAQLGETVEYIAPFVCIMANVVAKKYNILTWTGEIIDYILKCGHELYGASKFRYDQVSKLEIPRITLGINVFTVLVEYVFDSYTRQNILELALDKILFVRSDTGVIVTPTYACAVMFRNHLYYLYDPFGNSELGLSEGIGEKGVAVFARFKDLHALTTRIMFNKQKRESTEEVVYSRFVLSSVKIKVIRDYGDGATKKKKPKGGKEQLGGAEGPPLEMGEGEEGPPEEEPPAPENKVGYHFENDHWMILGTKQLPDREKIVNHLKEDHFICVCACLMLLNTPVAKWDTRKVNIVFDYGIHVYSQAEDLWISEKRTIKNILIGNKFFDVVIRWLEIAYWASNKDLGMGMETLFMRRFTYFLIQFPNACLVVHKSSDGFYHIFDPYGNLEDKPAGWMRCQTFMQLKKELCAKMIPRGQAYKFYTFEVTHIANAPKSFIISHKLEAYRMQPPPGKKEKVGKPFYEDPEWLKMDPIMWSHLHAKAANGKPRGGMENMWHSWDEEYPKDLWSMLGNINQRSERFDASHSGKQTLASLVVSIGMTSIYELAEWNPAVIDSVLVNGDNYFAECTQGISDENYELTMDDCLPDCSIFPFSFKVAFTPVVEGTMFLVRVTQFNLYKALRFFFVNNSLKYRCGIIMLTKTTRKRQIAFGKLRESEYFVFDADCRGTPMFVEGQDVAYILRMTTLNRLLHVLTVTLRGGDFYIYEVKVSDLKPLS